MFTMEGSYTAWKGKASQHWNQLLTVLFCWTQPAAGPGENCLAERGHVRRVCFSPDGQLLAAADRTTLTVWNLHDRIPVVTFMGHSARVIAVHFSPDGKLLASAGDDGVVKVWKVDRLSSPDYQESNQTTPP